MAGNEGTAGDGEEGCVSGTARRPLERHYTVDDLVESGMFSNRATLWAWCRDRKIRHLRLGGMIVIPETALGEFIKSHTVDVVTKPARRRKCACGKLFQPNRATSKWCNNSCMVKYHGSRKHYGDYGDAHQALLKLQRNTKRGNGK